MDGGGEVCHLLAERPEAGSFLLSVCAFPDGTTKLPTTETEVFAPQRIGASMNSSNKTVLCVTGFRFWRGLESTGKVLWKENVFVLRSGRPLLESTKDARLSRHVCGIPKSMVR